jgi:hypothetical protein
MSIALCVYQNFEKYWIELIIKDWLSVNVNWQSNS